MPFPGGKSKGKKESGKNKDDSGGDRNWRGKGKDV